MVPLPEGASLDDLQCIPWRHHSNDRYAKAKWSRDRVAGGSDPTSDCRGACRAPDETVESCGRIGAQSSRDDATAEPVARSGPRPGKPLRGRPTGQAVSHRAPSPWTDHGLAGGHGSRSPSDEYDPPRLPRTHPRFDRWFRMIEIIEQQVRSGANSQWGELPVRRTRSGRAAELPPLRVGRLAAPAPGAARVPGAAPARGASGGIDYSGARTTCSQPSNPGPSRAVSARAQRFSAQPVKS